MSKVFPFLLLIIGVWSCSTLEKTQPIADTPKNIHYDISPIKDKEKALLQIKVTFQPEKNGITRLFYKEQSWGQDSLFNLLSGLKIIETKGEVTLNRDSNWIELKHPKNLESLSFQYNLKQDTSSPLIIDNFYRPIIQPDYFHVFAIKLFVLPNAVGQPITTRYNIAINWNRFADDFAIHNSFGSNEKQQQLTNITMEDFQSAVFLGGNFRLYPIDIQGNKVFFAIRGEWVKFDDATMIDILEKTFIAQRNFWQDHSQPYYTVTLVPTFQEHGSSFQGTGLTNSFAMCASNNENLELDGLVYLFNHELQHNWTGGIIQNEAEESQYWFSEGFTDYYTWKNIANNKINGLGSEFFIQEINDCIQHLYTSPVREAPNSDIKTNTFWSNRDYEKLPYRRGALLAFYLDRMIQKQTAGKQSLDDLMIQFKEDAIENGQKISHDYFVKTASQFVGTDFKAFFDKHIKQGKLLDLKELFTDFDLEFEPQAEVYDLGFKFSEDRKSILEVTENSNAFKAGLRADDLITYRSMYGGSTKHPVDLKIRRNGKEKAISFMPLKKADIPQLKQNAANRNQLLGKNFDYLVGKWVRTNDKVGPKTYEHWSKKNEEEYIGIGFTLTEKDTVFKENLRLIKINNVWNYEVTGVNETPTYFKFSSQSANKFVCENPTNEFPKKIVYQLSGDSLRAFVSAGETNLTFDFQKLSKTAELSANLEEIYANSELPGFSAMVVNETGVLYEQSLGMANIKKQQKFTSHTVQNIASVSKTLIGVSLMKLVEQGKLKLDDAINNYLPFKVTNPNFPNQPITIRHLATHTSSILDTDNYFKSYYFYDGATLQATDLSKEYQEMLPYAKTNQLMDESELLENLLAEKGAWYAPTNFSKNAPGSAFEYSNVGATLAGYIIEKISRLRYEDFTKKHIFMPLKMNETGWELADINQAEWAQRYFQKNKEVPNYYLITKADGSLLTNTNDYSKFFIEMIKGFNGQGKLLSKASYTTLFSNQFEISPKQASGIFWIVSKEKNSFMHDGSDPGVMTLVSYNKEKGIGRIFFGNLDAAEENIGPIIGIWRALAQQDWTEN